MTGGKADPSLKCIWSSRQATPAALWQTNTVTRFMDDTRRSLTRDKIFTLQHAPTWRLLLARVKLGVHLARGPQRRLCGDHSADPIDLHSGGGDGASYAVCSAPRRQQRHRQARAQLLEVLPEALLYSMKQNRTQPS